MGELTLDQKQKVVESLEKKQATTDSINKNLSTKNRDLQDTWSVQSYDDHKNTFEKEYYPKWSANKAYAYKEKLAAMQTIKVDDTLTGTFDKQQQPGERFFYKSRNNEKKTIEKYKKDFGEENIRFDKNTVREMSALNKYNKYHEDYFSTRNHQNDLYTKYTKEDKKEETFSRKWKLNINVQRKKYGKFFGTLTGALSTIKNSVVDGIFGKNEEKKGFTRKQELDEGLRPFFSMTKKSLFWKKQVGLLGTESKEERKDGSEYNKRLLNVYTTGKPKEKVELMDELADKIMAFKLTPNMFTNKYMAKNMLQMQRYTDMLNGFVALTKFNPEYLDTTNDDAVHTSPEMGALVKSRIVLMAPIMTRFMTQHAKYFGYKKDKGVLGKSRIDSTMSDFKNDAEYDAFAKETWEMVKQAYNSTVDFFDDLAEVKMRGVLEGREELAKKNREKRKLENNDDSEFEVKYDALGWHADRLKSVKDKIASNPYIYEIYGGDLDQIFNRINEMTRRLDEVEARSDALAMAGENAEQLTFKNVEKFGDMWKAYVDKETLRYNAERDILTQRLDHYEKTVDYLVGQKLDQKDLKLSDPSPEVANVLEYEGLNHVAEIKKAFEYNDLFYKTLDYYDFDKYKDFSTKDGKKVPIDDLWTQYNFTLLKRGMERARLVNRMVDGKTTVDIHDVTKLNNIEKRAVCNRKFNNAEKTVKQLNAAMAEELKRRETAKKNGEIIEGDILDTEVTVVYRKRKEGAPPQEGDTKTFKLRDLKKYQYSLKEIATANIEELTAKYNITKEMDITQDETYEKYFQVKSIADIADALEKDPSGKSVDGFLDLTKRQQDEVRIRSELFRDYFKRWQGQMTYTRSEAYEYLGDTANMQGNNSIIEGIDKKYRKNIINTMSEKIYERRSNETDEDTRDKLYELYTFLSGMQLENEYDAKAIKLFGKDAYDAYKARYFERKTRAELEKLYGEDFDELVKQGLKKGGEKEKKEYLKRVDTGLALKSECEKYQVMKKEEEKKKKPGLEPGMTEKEKADFLSGQYHRFLDTVKKYNIEAGDERYIVENLSYILRDLDSCIDFLQILRGDGVENYQFLADAEKFTDDNLADMDRYEQTVYAYVAYVNCVLRDYGIPDSGSAIVFESRKESKRKQIRRDDKYKKEFKKASQDLIELNERERQNIKEDKELEAEIERVKKLYNEEEKRQEELEKINQGVQDNIKEEPKEYELNGKRILGKNLVLTPKNKYADQYWALVTKRRTFSQKKEYLTSLHNYLFDIYDEKVEKEELTEDGVRGDYLTKTKEKLREEFETLTNYTPLVKSRNYVEELFKYIRKNAGDADLTDPEAVKKVLTEAKDAWFFELSVGAKKEAMLRLNEYEKDKTSMNDYFIWKNGLDTNEVLAERAKVFGQDKFVKKNIGKIREIMDAIGEANASINDMQTPEFLDRLADDLEIKGIDERQFMFLLRKHNVGFSGLSNTVKDADKALKNRVDVYRYLDVKTRNDFLIETAKDVLAAGKELDIENINEEYIISNFARCYFTANKMMAFQQLYYSERDSYKQMELDGGENAGLVANIRRYFDKGHGEAYALYYNVVMSVATKYGVSADGSLCFGLPVEELEKLYKEGKSNKETEKTVAENLKNAEIKSTENFNEIKEAYKQNKMSMTIEDAISNSLAGAEANACPEYADANNGAASFIESFKAYENEVVSYTQRSADYPGGMFLMAKDQSFVNGQNMAKNRETAVNFKNLFIRNEENVARNLSVIDEEKCKRVLNRIRDMGLDKGEIGKDKTTGNKLADEAYMDQNFSKEFYEDMINAQNYCMMFEMNEDFLNIEGYERRLKEMLSTNATVLPLYEEQKKKLEDSKLQQDKLTDQKLSTDATVENLKARLEQSIADGDQDYTDMLRENIAELEKQSKEIWEIYIGYGEAEKAYEQSVNNLYKQADLKDSDYVTEGKLNTLKQLKEMFSDKHNRFIISSYVDLFAAYLLKNGIKIDGSYTNSQIFDEALEGRAVYNKESKETAVSQAQALQMGVDASWRARRNHTKIYNKKVEYVTSGQYKKEYDELQKKEKK